LLPKLQHLLPLFQLHHLLQFLFLLLQWQLPPQLHPQLHQLPQCPQHLLLVPLHILL
jgi:hypothetical protein